MAPLKILLNVKESFEAKELLRQRHLPNGTTENLVSCSLVFSHCAVGCCY